MSGFCGGETGGEKSGQLGEISHGNTGRTNDVELFCTFHSLYKASWSCARFSLCRVINYNANNSLPYKGEYLSPD